MRRSTLTVCALLAVASWACKKDEAPQQGPGLTLQADTTAPAATAPPPAPPAAPAPPQVAVRDEPYASEDTGTIAPGMSQNEVIAMWGVPVSARTIGDMTYLYFRNGCEASCGTMDVVFLQNGAVVDAIVRWPGHNYAGESSSPPPPGGRKPWPTRPGDTTGTATPTTP